MTRRLTAVATSLGILLCGSAAQAQERSAFGQQGQFIIGADRLFSLFSFTHISVNEFSGGGNTTTVDTTNGTGISLLWGSSPVGGIISPFTVPRVGLDYVIIPHLTIGGDLAVFFTLGGSTSTDTTVNGTTMSTSQDNPSQFLFGIEPRAGYLLPINNMLTLWLRGGFSYFIQTQSMNANGQTQKDTQNQFALDLEPQVVFTLIPHVGFTAGLTFDVPLTGGHATDTTFANGTTTSQSAGESVLFFGVTAGMVAYF